MRFLSFVLFTLVIHLNICAQYTLTTTSENYEHLTGGSVLDESSTWQINGFNIYNGVSIGFDFVINGDSFDTVFIAENGHVTFLTDTLKYYISIFDADLKNYNFNALFSPIFYETSGIVGNRIFKCEYKTAGFYNDPEQDDSVSFQLWMYESCSDFEVRIGDHEINSNVYWNGNSAPFIGIGNYDNFWNHSYLDGDPISPILVSGASAFMDFAPPSGTVYTFHGCNSNYLAEEEVELSIYPNPARDLLYLKSPLIDESTTLELYQMDGTRKSLFHYQILFESIRIECNNLNSGIYILKANFGNNQTHVSKINID